MYLRVLILKTIHYAKIVSRLVHACTHFTINIVMKQFRTTLSASVVMATVTHTDNVNFSMKILQALFGSGNVMSILVEI